MREVAGPLLEASQTMGKCLVDALGQHRSWSMGAQGRQTPTPDHTPCRALGESSVGTAKAAWDPRVPWPAELGVQDKAGAWEAFAGGTALLAFGLVRV